VEGDATKVEHGQDIGEGQLVLEREANDVKIPEWSVGFEATEWLVVESKLGFHVEPGTKDALDAEIITFIDDGVQDFGAQVAHPDVVKVGKAEGHSTVDV
jgi:hypothetical protein